MRKDLKKDSEEMIRDLKFHYRRMKRLQEELKLIVYSIGKRFFLWECFTFVMVSWLAVTTYMLFHNVFLAVFFPLTVFLFVWNNRVGRLNELKSQRKRETSKSIECIVEETVLYIQEKILIHSRYELKRLKAGIRRALNEKVRGKKC